jgi:hypothetical protein
MNEKVVVVTENEPLRITTVAGQDPRSRTCIYVSLDSEGKLIIVGGASIVSRIEGDGMREKVV